MGVFESKLGDLRVVLTKRSATLRHHSSEVSFPGGVRESSDNSLWQTALRETHEETGLDPSLVRQIGVEEDLQTSISKMLIRPFVAEIPCDVEWRPDPSEVESLLFPPLAMFSSPHRTQTVERGNKSYDILFFDYDSYLVWGATARILWRLANRI